MFEEVGAVKLNLDSYSGNDYYSEGADEDLLLELVKNSEPKDYNRLIAENAGWSRLYHLSDLRGNIVDFLPVTKSDDVLEVGAGCGAITGTLCKKAKSVTAIELSKKRSLINAYRNKDASNLEIRVGNFQDIEKTLTKQYDYIMLIGVLEYAASYIRGVKPEEVLLNILLSHLKDGGRLVIAIENKYGLKYWAGCREDHLGTFYSGIEGYGPESPVKTFSRHALMNLMKKTGCKVNEFYPFPDYKLPVTIYSNDRLPRKGELTDAAPNFDNSRIVAFDERQAFDELIDEGRFPEYSNSFLLVLEKGTRVESFTVRNPIYSRHSNERDPKYAIRTDILRDGNGKQFVVKYPMTEAANAHIESMEESYAQLSKQYEDTIFVPNACRIVKNDEAQVSAEFDYVEGRTLDEILIQKVEDGDKKYVLDAVKKYCDAVKSLPKTGYSNLDLIFTNIFPDEKTGKWIVIDYEWTKSKDERPEFIIFRALRYFVNECIGLGYGKLMEELSLFELCGIDEIRMATFEEEELSLQREIAGDRISLIGYNSIFGQDALSVQTLIDRSLILKRIDRVKVYYDLGNGFNEENTAFVCGQVKENDRVCLDIPITQEVKALRIDPSDDACMIKLEQVPAATIQVNGLSLDGGVVFFPKEDPQIVLTELSYTDNVHIEYEVAAFNERFYTPVADALLRSHPSNVKDALRSVNVMELIKKKGPYEKVRL